MVGKPDGYKLHPTEPVPVLREYQYITNISSALYSFQMPTFMCYTADRRRVATVLWRNPEHWICTHLGFHFFWTSVPCTTKRKRRQ